MKILITDKMAEEATEILKNAGYDVFYNEMDSETLHKEISKYDALMIRSRTKVGKEIISAGIKGKLKVIGRAGIGVDNIDLESATENKIMVVNAPTGATVSVAELVIGLMLSLSRHITKADSAMKIGEWNKKYLKGSELYLKTLGLIGCGNIGKKSKSICENISMGLRDLI